MSQSNLLIENRAALLLKPDAFRDKCIPTIFEVLTSSGFLLGPSFHIDVNSEDAYLLYCEDFNNPKMTEETRSLVEMRMSSVVGCCMLQVVYFSGPENAWQKLSSMKGSATNAVPYTLRGKTWFPIPDHLKGDPQKERMWRATHSRIHVPRTHDEKEVLSSLLRRKNIDLVC